MGVQGYVHFFLSFSSMYAHGIDGDVLQSLLFALEVCVIYDFEVSCRLLFFNPLWLG
jgi:hypothetical protein